MAGAKGRSGGARPGAGRKPAPPVTVDARSLQTTDPDEFLAAVMADPSIDFKMRMEAALALKKAGKGGGGPKGKREAQADAAAAVVERGRSLAPASAPRARLAVVK